LTGPGKPTDPGRKPGHDDKDIQEDLRQIARKLRKLYAGSRRAGRKADQTRDASPPATTRRGIDALHVSNDPTDPRRLDAPATLHVGDLRRRARKAPAAGQPEPLPREPAMPRHSTVDLEQAAPGVESPSEDGTAAYIISERITEREPAWGKLGKAFAALLPDPEHAVGQRLGRMCGPPALNPEDFVFLDLETTGLESTPLFLIGAMYFEQGGFVVRQYFARHYGEERACISLFAADAAEKRLLVTFNGKSFDWPFVKMRAAATRLPFSIDIPHLDLLHEARRVWGRELPNCKLQTLEDHICGRGEREGDIPGREIPNAYHDYVRSQDATQMVTVLEHNYLDLVTLADILVRLPE